MPTTQQSQWKLSMEFKKELDEDNFVCVGVYGVDGKNHTIELNRGCDWTLTIYTFVSFANGGKHIRIGCVGSKKSTLKGRLKPY